MDEIQDVVAALTDEECWTCLGTQQLGRLVTNAAGVLDVFPVNYIVDGESVVFRTAEGSKLFELMLNESVLFEVDDHTDDEAWSVVVRGAARRLETAAEVERADALALRPWIPTLKYNYVRIVPTSMSGRAFHRGEEPDRYGVAEY